MTIEERYIASVPIEHRKKFAQFFTPETIAQFMCDWVVNNGTVKKVLDPAFGLGVFSRLISKVSNASIDAYEIDSNVISYAKKHISSNVNIINEDYLESNWDNRYDAIICNPPYFKFHDYDNAKYISNVNQHLNVKLSGFTNIYTLFLLKSISQLNEGGRLAYIVPSEFLNSDYGVEVKRALLESKTLRHVIVIDFKKCAFEDALTTACILLCQKEKALENISFSTVSNIENLQSTLNDDNSIVSPYDLDPKLKWKMFYEKTQSVKYHDLVPFSRFAKVSRGIATGANDYFTFKKSKAEKYNINEKCLLPCICHAADVDGLIFDESCYNLLELKDKAVFLFNGQVDAQNQNIRNYIDFGEKNKVNERYLTANRKPWYAIENRKPAPIWVSVFNRNGLRFVRNKAGVYNLTTFHCVYNRGVVDTDVLFAYLITDVAKEIFLDNSRQYGNGLIKFEPNDLNKGKVVDLSLLTEKEKDFIKEIYHLIENDTDNQGKYINQLNDFFKKKYGGENGNIDVYNDDICKNETKRNLTKTKVGKLVKARQMDLMDVFEI